MRLRLSLTADKTLSPGQLGHASVEGTSSLRKAEALGLLQAADVQTTISQVS